MWPTFWLPASRAKHPIRPPVETRSLEWAAAFLVQAAKQKSGLCRPLGRAPPDLGQRARDTHAKHDQTPAEYWLPSGMREYCGVTNSPRTIVCDNMHPNYRKRLPWQTAT